MNLTKSAAPNRIQLAESIPYSEVGKTKNMNYDFHLMPASNRDVFNLPLTSEGRDICAGKKVAIDWDELGSSPYKHNEGGVLSDIDESTYDHFIPLKHRVYMTPEATNAIKHADEKPPQLAAFFTQVQTNEGRQILPIIMPVDHVQLAYYDLEEEMFDVKPKPEMAKESQSAGLDVIKSLPPQRKEGNKTFKIREA